MAIPTTLFRTHSSLVPAVITLRTGPGGGNAFNGFSQPFTQIVRSGGKPLKPTDE